MKLLVVYDFDWSLVDQDSDRYIFEVLSPRLRQKLRELKPTVQWTDLIDQTLGDLHAHGFTRKQIEDTLQSIPFHPAQKRAIKNLRRAAEPETTFFLLSNANTIFIANVLKAQGLEDFFHETVTNYAHWEPQERLRVQRRCPPPPSEPQHNCHVGCSANMCKGAELDAFIKRRARGEQKKGMDCPPGLNGKSDDEFKGKTTTVELTQAREGWDTWDQVIYIGDGGNDFCPLLRMRNQDLALVRIGKDLEARVKAEGQSAGLQCKVQYWSMADEIERVFETLQGRGW